MDLATRLKKMQLVGVLAFAKCPVKAVVRR